MTNNLLTSLEHQASSADLLLRIQVRRPLNLWTVRLVVAKYVAPQKVQLLAEMKGWAYNASNGLQLDTMQVSRNAPIGVGHLVWASTMAWAIDSTPCRRARLLAINDEETQHKILTRYFQRKGFKIVREVGNSPLDLPFRIVWGGAGSLMNANCIDVYNYSCQLWEKSQKRKLVNFEKHDNYF